MEGQRTIDIEYMRNIMTRFQTSKPFRIKFWNFCNKRQSRLEDKSAKLVRDSLDIKNLMKAEIFNRLAFKFILTKQELSYVKALEKNRRLLIDTMSSSDTEELEEVVANSDQRKAKNHSSDYSSQQVP